MKNEDFDKATAIRDDMRNLGILLGSKDYLSPYVKMFLEPDYQDKVNNDIESMLIGMMATLKDEFDKL